MQSLPRKLLVVALMLATASTLLAWHWRKQAAHRITDPAQGTEALSDYGPIGPFHFTERSGQVVTEKTLDGKIWLIGCFFTCCTESCPALSGSMARLQHELAPQLDVRLVSLTVDPDRDTPSALNQYATAFNADKERWLFITGTTEEVHQFVKNRLHLGVEENRGPDRSDGNRVLHSPKLTVVDGKGRIRGYFDGTDPDAVGRLRDAVIRLCREGK